MIYISWISFVGNIPDISAIWMRGADPVSLRPAVQPLNHCTAEFIRANQPSDLPDERIGRALAILASHCPRCEEIMLRDWFRSDENGGVSLAGYLIERILETGLEPTSPQLSPIQPEDIELRCCIGIEQEGERDNS